MTRRLFLRLFVLLLLLSLAPQVGLILPVAAQCGTPAPTYEDIVLGTQSEHLIAYFPLNETSGTVAYDLSGNVGDGTYSGVTLAAETFLNGEPAPSFDGVNDYASIYSVSLDSLFDRNAGTLLAWRKVESWVTGTNGAIVHIAASVTPANYVLIRKEATNNTIGFYVSFGGTAKSIMLGSQFDSGWRLYAITWDKTTDQAKAYINSDQVGSTLSGLGTWSGSLSSNLTLIGASRISAFADPFLGSIAHVAIWDTPLSETEIADLSDVPSGATPTPCVPTPTADLFVHWTGVPPETTGTPEPGQPFGFGYVATAGQIGIAVLLAAILFVLVAVSVIGLLRRRK